MESEEVQVTTQKSDDLEGGDFVSEGLHVKLTLSNDGVSWKNLQDKKSVPVVIEWADVIRCHKGQVSKRSPTEVPEWSERDPCFTVHYIEKQKNYTWKHKYKIFHSSECNFDDIVSTISTKSKKNKPGRLLVLINPVSGTGKGEAQFAKIVAPLFRLAQIDTDVIVSKDPKHPEETGKTYDFSAIDGVVIVGGDGTLQMLMHSWLLRIQRNAGIDVENPDAKFSPLTCPVGMIPTGTGNGLARGNYGCSDVATAALNIISGRKMTRMLLSVSSGGRHMGFSGIILGSGSFGDLLDTSLESRWLGWFRYPIGFINIFFRRRREFYIDLKYLPYVSPKSYETSSGQTSSATDWISVDGYHTGVMCIPGIFTPNEATGKMKVDGNSGGVTLIFERQCGQFKYFRWMFKMMQFSKDMFQEDFITVKEIKAYKLQIVQREGENKSERQLSLEKNINLDGEIRRLDNTDIFVRTHPNMMDMYGTAPLF